MVILESARTVPKLTVKDIGKRILSIIVNMTRGVLRNLNVLNNLLGTYELTEVSIQRGTLVIRK